MKISIIKDGLTEGELIEWQHESCTALFGFGENWVTLYSIQSLQPGQGHATELLREAKKKYEAEGKEFGGTIALNTRMQRIYERLGIREYSEF